MHLSPSEGTARDVAGALLDRLYRAIGGVAGCRYIVDSSKSPAHALLVRAEPPLNAQLRDPPTALTSFQQAFTAHSNINAALIPNDENGAPIITYLKTKGVKPDTFPTTGQDATLTGLQNVLSGYQCGTVYKAVYKEAEAAVALALYLRAGKTPPSSLANGSTMDTKSNTAVPSVLLAPVWVTPKNMSTTIVKDKFVPTAQLCAGAAATACKKAGIS